MPLPLVAGAVARTVGQGILQGAAGEVGGRAMDKLLGDDSKKEAPEEKAFSPNQEKTTNAEF
ncbi:hypothetical protein TDB9533_00061 [Thalassocella blandensis]|nr:hypothetical protein TDB9533_00061 [Thalassocella blandensis]